MLLFIMESEDVLKMGSNKINQTVYNKQQHNKACSLTVHCVHCAPRLN